MSQVDVDDCAKAIFVHIMDEIADAAKLQKGLVPTRIYLGTVEWAILAQWSNANGHMEVKEKRQTLNGYRLHRVSESNHLFVAWE